MVRRILLFFIVLSPLNGTFAQTLEEAVVATLRTNPDILAGKHNVEAALQLRRQAKGAYLPSVDLVVAGGEEISNNTTTRAARPNVGGVSVGDGDFRLFREEKSLKITQLLYDGFSTINLIKQQTALTDAAMARLTSVQENISLRAIQVYLEVLRRDDVVVLAIENLRHHEDTLRKIRERFENGVGTKVDVVQTQGRRAQSKGNVLLSQRDAKNGTAEFYRVIGENPNDLVKPTKQKAFRRRWTRQLKLPTGTIRDFKRLKQNLRQQLPVISRRLRRFNQGLISNLVQLATKIRMGPPVVMMMRLL